ncbi:MAG: hypothetical protein K1X88_03505 [Nannocystaceae bacterium]|nr:hypothetical protein [Nannocystaceae bacterium]
MSAVVGLAIALGVARLFGRANKEESRPGFFGLLQWCVLLVVAVVVLRGVLAGRPVAFAALPPLLIALFPWRFTTAVLVPRGMVRTAWFVVRGSTWVWFDDNRGGALVAAAWACLRGGGQPRDVAFVERRLGDDAAGAANLLATGLLAQAQGDVVAARRGIDRLVEFEGRVAPAQARRLAVQWCAAEAASRDAWARVAALGDDRDADATTTLLAAIARRMLGRAPVPEPSQLRALLRRVPRRAAFAAAVERACVHEVAADVVAPPPAPPAAATAPPLPAALRHHAALLGGDARGRAADVAAIEALCKAWDLAFEDRATAAAVAARRAALGAKLDPWLRLRETVDADLLALVHARGLPIGEDPASKPDSFGRLRRRVRQRLLDELELHADALHTRVRARRALPVHEEWREYLTLRGAYDHAIAMTGMGLHRLAFQAVHPAVCALAVWLWNDRKNRVHAHQMFRWLLREAELVEDAEAVALQRRNVDAGK